MCNAPADRAASLLSPTPLQQGELSARGPAHGADKPSTPSGSTPSPAPRAASSASPRATSRLGSRCSRTVTSRTASGPRALSTPPSSATSVRPALALCGERADRDGSDGWDRNSHTMTKNAYGVFEILLKGVNGGPRIAHNSKVKVSPPCGWHAACRSSLTMLDLHDHPRDRRADREDSRLDQVSWKDGRAPLTYRVDESHRTSPSPPSTMQCSGTPPRSTSSRTSDPSNRER